MRRLLALIAGVSIVLLGGFLRVAAAEPPRIVVSIAPLHSLVAAVSAGVSTPTLLVRGAGSPHGHTMRPSDARALQAADLVIWIGPILEPFLDRALRDPIARRRVIPLLNEATITVLPARTTDHADDDHGHEEDSSATADPHLWLDPSNAAAIVALTTRSLAEIDPANETVYRTNAARLTQRLLALDAALSQTLAPIADAPF
ncbi:MAG: zinc ABC transporter solute-binding protein, partial [Rhodospirillaceae bacterium]|nr:zinc ABC transporter solute-binding protein [Rhodospirillaceae bacterium]